VTKTKPMPKLEESLTEITQLIDTMERGDVSLEQSLTQFERGITLIKHCQKILETAEQKVNILMQKNNKETLTPYSDGDNDANADDE
jgi:exodeoxyribonuclease VII small subunit